MKKMSFILLCCSAFLVACDKASEKVSDAIDDKENLIDKAGSLVNDATVKVSGSIDNTIDSTVNAAKDTSEKVVDITQEKVTTAIDSAKTSASDAVDDIKDAGSKITNDVKDKADTVVASVSKEPVSETVAGVDLKEGEKTFKMSCIACHGSGIAGSPKVGEKADWEARLEKGNAVLIEHAINGFRGEDGYYMPAKGGYKDLSDEQVANAVEYMVSKVK